MKVHLTQYGIDTLPADLYDDRGLTLSNLYFLINAGFSVMNARHQKVIALAIDGIPVAFLNYGASDEDMYSILDYFLVKIKVVVDY